MSDSLRNKVVVITGASSGIGHSIALESAGRGATVILIARNEAKLAKVASETHELSGAPAYTIVADMNHSDQIDAAFKQIVQLTKHVAYLVNCAGFGKFENFLESNRYEVTAMFQVNVLGLMYFTRLIGRLMIDQKAGQIVNIGSIAGKVPTVKSFGVKVMTVNPGPVYTNFFNIADKSGHYAENVQRFMLDPDDVAWQVVHFFGSNKRELNLPVSLGILAKLYNLFPTIGDKLSLKFASRK